MLHANYANKDHFTLTVSDANTKNLQVLAFDAIEGIDSEYIVELTLINSHIRYDITQLLNKNAYLSFSPDNNSGIHGQIQLVKRGPVGKDYTLFKIILAPRFNHLYHETNQRAFVGKTVLEIISSVLAEKGYQQGQEFVFKLKDNSVYLPREFCCQYDESTAHFIHRLCEEEGIHLHYEFSRNNHKLVLSDANPFFPKMPNPFQYMADTGFVADYPVFKQFDVNLSSATTSASYRNYHFQNMKIPEGTSQGTQHQQANNTVEPRLEYYDYPQYHINKKQGERYAQLQIERLRTNQIQAEATSDISLLHSGQIVSLEGYPSIDTLNTGNGWLITELYHQGRQPQVLEKFSGATTAIMQEPSLLFKYYLAPINQGLQFSYQDFEQGYRNCLVAIPKDTPYRPQSLHPKQRVLGSQTAIVTGAAGEEIYTDEYGRVKVLFHWDRINPQNEQSSHWIRVASNWAHNQYGSVVIPRVGMEVKVDFLEGDIDNPIVTGALHNGINKVPYQLPANKTLSVFKTSSSKGGLGSNEFRIEDKAGAEQIFVQAQKDFDQLTKNNHTIEVKNNSHLQVQNEHSETIVGNRYQKQQSEEHHLTLKDRKTQLMMNDYKEVAVSEHTTIGTILTTEAGQEIHLKAGMQCVIDGGLSLTLKAGGQHIVLNPAGIWMTMPVWTGGAPMQGTPAVPLMPLTKAKAVEAVTAPLVSLKPYSQQTNNLKFHFKDNHQQPYANTPYIAYLPDGTTQQGITDNQGYTSVFYSDDPQGIDIHLLIDNEGDSISNTLASQGNNNLQFQLKDDDEIPYANTPYIAYFQDGTSLEGTTDENGYTKVFNTLGEQHIDIHLAIGNTSKEEKA